MQVGAKWWQWRQWWWRAYHFSGDNEGTLKLFFGTVYLWQWWKLLFWKLHKISIWLVKKKFCCNFFRCFLITSHILMKLRQYSVLLRHFSCAMNQEWWFMKKNNWKQDFKFFTNWEFLIFQNFSKCILGFILRVGYEYYWISQL